MPVAISKTFHSAVYHCTVIRLFRPFLDSSEQPRLGSFSSEDGTPSTVFLASLNQLKQLLYTYQTQSPRLFTIAFINVAVAEVSYSILKTATQDPHWRFYFRLCLDFWKDAYVRYRVFYVIVQANLSHALRAGAIDSAEARTMMDELRAVGKHHQAPERAVTTALFDFELAMKNQQGADVITIAKQFDDLVILGELIRDDLDETTVVPIDPQLGLSAGEGEQREVSKLQIRPFGWR
jgi:hypothetical protein